MCLLPIKHLYTITERYIAGKQQGDSYGNIQSEHPLGNLCLWTCGAVMPTDEAGTMSLWRSMSTCPHCQGFIQPEACYDHGVTSRMYHCLPCARYYPISTQTAQVAIEKTRKPPDPAMFRSHVCQACGKGYKSVRITKSQYCSMKCKELARYNRRKRNGLELG